MLRTETGDVLTCLGQKRDEKLSSELKGGTDEDAKNRKKFPLNKKQHKNPMTTKFPDAMSWEEFSIRSVIFSFLYHPHASEKKCNDNPEQYQVNLKF